MRPQLLNQLREKIYRSVDKLAKQVANWQSEGETVVFTNGCFDILHPGHVAYLAETAALGTKLIIGVNTDRSVSALKGPHRPIQLEESRLQVLAALGFVDALILFDEPTPLELITRVKPNVLAKGGDYSIETIVGAEFVQENGGQVKVIPFVEGYSTTAIEKRILEAQKS